MATVAPLEPATWLAKSKAKAIRIQNIRGNKAMPDQAQLKLEDAAPNFTVINQYGNGRALYVASQPAETLFEWTKDQLKPSAEYKVAADKSARIHFFPPVEAQKQDQNWPNLGPKGTEAAKSTDAKEKDKPKQN